ncbi:MAG: hypothetical protein QM777_00405, partial [Pseudorhodoferax sp.]
DLARGRFAELLDRVAQGVRPVQHVLRARQEMQPGFRQFQATACSVKKSGADILLQGREPLAERGLGQFEFGRGPGRRLPESAIFKKTRS